MVTLPMGDSNCEASGYFGTAAYGVAIQGAKIVLAGCAQVGTRTKFALARLNEDGSLDDDTVDDSNQADTPFGTAGRVLTDVSAENEYAYAMSLVLDGTDIVVGGFAEIGASGDLRTLVRYSEHGTLTDGPDFAGSGRIVALARQPDGKIVGVGPVGAPARFTVARFLSTGSLDPAFGSGGVRETAFPQGSAFAGGVAIRPDGKIIVAGKVNVDTTDNGFGVARYTPEGALDTTFGTDATGIAFHSLGSPPRVGIDQTGVVLQNDGKIVVAGAGGGIAESGGGNFATARLFGDAVATDGDGDGVLDSADNCVGAPNADQANQDGDSSGDACDGDDDNDTRTDDADNCVAIANSDQANTDGDSAGDACDADDDNDNVLDATDNCRTRANLDQADNDDDGTGNACDETPGSGFATVTINDGAIFTGSPEVVLTIVPPAGATGVTISNDGGFAPSEDFELQADGTYDWELDRTPGYSKDVYVRFSGPGLEAIEPDDAIFLDRVKPVVSVRKRNKARNRLPVLATDRDALGSGVVGIQVTPNRSRPGPTRKFKPSKPFVRVSPNAGRLHVRVIDKVGNRSGWRRERRGNR
jgi:uncharacterized delta-60 repeat protein